MAVVVNIVSPTPAFHVTINITIPHLFLVVGFQITPNNVNIASNSTQYDADKTTLSIITPLLFDVSSVKIDIQGYISPSALPGQSVDPYVMLHYTSLPSDGEGGAGEEYSDVVPIPNVLISSVTISFNLTATSDQFTDSNLLTYHEFGVFELTLADLNGPISELTVSGSHDKLHHLSIAHVSISFQG